MSLSFYLASEQSNDQPISAEDDQPVKPYPALNIFNALSN